MDISSELAKISSYKGFFTLTVGGDGAGWHPVRQSYADGWADLIEATARRYHTADLRIGASLVHLGYATRLWSPVLACALGHGVVPDLKDLQRADDGAQLRIPEPVGQPVDSPSAALLYRIVVEQHMKPFAAGLRVKLATALLAGNIASALVGASRALLIARRDLRPSIVEMTVSLLDIGMLAGSGVITGSHLGFRRRSCCLFYRVPGRDPFAATACSAGRSDRTGDRRASHHWSRGTSKSTHNARQTSRGSTPSSMAWAAVRSSKLVST